MTSIQSLCFASWLSPEMPVICKEVDGHVGDYFGSRVPRKGRRGVAAVQHGRHAERDRGLEIPRQVVDEHAGRGRQAEPLGRSA